MKLSLSFLAAEFKARFSCGLREWAKSFCGPDPLWAVPIISFMSPALTPEKECYSVLILTFFGNGVRQARAPEGGEEGSHGGRTRGRSDSMPDSCKRFRKRAMLSVRADYVLSSLQLSDLLKLRLSGHDRGIVINQRRSRVRAKHHILW
jgi:hypothetical protein